MRDEIPYTIIHNPKAQVDVLVCVLLVDNKTTLELHFDGLIPVLVICEEVCALPIVV